MCFASQHTLHQLKLQHCTAPTVFVSLQALFSLQILPAGSESSASLASVRCSWWEPTHDTGLVLGVHWHGFVHAEPIRSDERLPFLRALTAMAEAVAAGTTSACCGVPRAWGFVGVCLCCWCVFCVCVFSLLVCLLVLLLFVFSAFVAHADSSSSFCCSTSIFSRVSLLAPQSSASRCMRYWRVVHPLQTSFLFGCHSSVPGFVVTRFRGTCWATRSRMKCTPVWL